MLLNIEAAIVKGQKEQMIYRKDKEEEEKQQVDLEESTSGKRRSNKWKEHEQQVEKGFNILQ